MSSRKFINNGDYQLVLENGRLIVKRPDAEQNTAAIEISYTGSEAPGFIGVTGGAFKYGFTDSVPFDVFHQGRPPDVTEIDLLDQDFPSAKSKNVLYVAENGFDSNSGERLSEPKRTLKSALAKAELIQAREMQFILVESQTHSLYNGQGNNGSFVGGSGYANGNTITLSNGAIITVNSVGGGGSVSQFTVSQSGSGNVIPRRTDLIQASTSGSGVGFSMIPNDANVIAQKPRPPVNIFVKAGEYRENNPLLVNRRVSVWGDSLRSTFMRPRVRPFQTRANFARGLLDTSGDAYNNDGSYSSAANDLSSAKSTIQDNIISYVETTYPSLLNTSQKSRCRRDVGFILDAIIRDLDTPSIGTYQNPPYLSGLSTQSNYNVTNAISQLSTTYNSERAAAYYYKRGVANIPPDQVAPTKDAIDRIKTELDGVGGNLSGTSLDIAKEFIDMIVDTLDLVLIDPTENPQVQIDRQSAASELQSAKVNIQNAIRNWIDDETNVIDGILDEELKNKCVRDSGLILDGVIKDLNEGGADGTEEAAKAYYRQSSAVIPKDQRQVTINALDQLVVEVENAINVSNTTGRDVATKLVQTVARTIEQPIDVVRSPTVSVGVVGGQVNTVTVDDGGFGYRNDPLPNAALTSVVNVGGYEDAGFLLRANRTYMQELIADYVNNEFQQGGMPLMTPEQESLCKRDTGFIFDAIIIDLIEGNTKECREAALNYYLNDASVLPQNQQIPTIKTFAQIAIAANSIIRNEPVPPLYSGQDTSSFGSVIQTLIPRITVADATEISGAFPAPTNVDPEDPNWSDDFGLIGKMIYGINESIIDPVFPAQLRVADIFAEVPQVDTTVAGYRPASLIFDIENNSITGFSIEDAGNMIGLPDGSYSISEIIPEPDDGYDLFYVNNGCYFSGMTFNGLSGRASAVAFDQLRRDPLHPVPVKGFITTSPYVQNCSTINPTEEGGVGMKINGRHVRGLRSMVSDAFTQINTAGTGVYLLNRGYAQLVSIFTVSTNIGLLAESGGQCSVANSNSSFGNFGLVSRGVSELLESGNIIYRRMINGQTQTNYTNRFSGGSDYIANDIITLTNDAVVLVDDVDVNGAVTEFTITSSGRPVLDNETVLQARTNRVIGGGTGFGITVLSNNLETVSETYPVFSDEFIVDFDSLGSRRPAFGDAILFDVEYSSTNVGQIYTFSGLNTIISDQPRIEIYNDGEKIPKYFYRIVTRAPDLEIEILPTYPVALGTITARLRKFYTVEESTDIISVTDGITQRNLAKVTLDLGITQSIDSSVEMQFFQRSLITSSAHTFEYVGAGTNFLEATPAAGGQPIRENEIVSDADLGGSVYFTSTDDKGDFKIGPELTINRNTGTITGEAFERSLFAVLTPYILSLEK